MLLLSKLPVGLSSSSSSSSSSCCCCYLCRLRLFSLLLLLLLLILQQEPCSSSNSDSNSNSHSNSDSDFESAFDDDDATTTNIKIINNNKFNETKLDCDMRLMAMDYANKILLEINHDNDNMQHLQLTKIHDALRLHDLCFSDNISTTTGLKLESEESSSEVSVSASATTSRYYLMRRNVDDDVSLSSHTRQQQQQQQQHQQQRHLLKDDDIIRTSDKKNDNNNLCSILYDSDKTDDAHHHYCIYVKVPDEPSSFDSTTTTTTTTTIPSTPKEDGSIEYPYHNIHDAIDHSRRYRADEESSSSSSYIAQTKIHIILRHGIHSPVGPSSTISLTSSDNNLSIEGFPGEQVWISGGLSLEGIKPQPIIHNNSDDEHTIFVYDLKELLLNQKKIPKLLSLFTTTGGNGDYRRYVRARYPNSNPEIDQWGYASPNRYNYSIDPASSIEEWHKPPKLTPPNFTFVDFTNHPPDGIPSKNDSTQPGYNWYASGYGGACEEIWGQKANSYWCSNASQGGWSEVDQECAITGQMQLPVGMTYKNDTSSSSLSLHRRFQSYNKNNTKGGIIHAWHSQSWSMHMFEIDQHHINNHSMTFRKGGGRQGGRNWCRCDQCTYAAHWCGQHQNPPNNNDTRLISGTWIIENLFDELDQPGEYYFDPKSFQLYVIPNTTSDLHDFRIGLSETSIIEIVDGATNITINNVGFRDMASTYMADDWSAPSGGDWSLHRGGAILICNNTKQTTISNCKFHRLDGNAIFLEGRTRNVTIERNQFEWIGENAIATWGDTDDYDGRLENFPLFTSIQYNIMSELGIYQKQSSAIGQCKSALTTIRYNIMFNMPRAAINFNDMLGGGDIIESNLIFNTCRESGDHGPINSWDRQPFLTTLRYGVSKASFDPIPRIIHHNFIFANYGGSQGVDNDDGSSWYNIHNNVFYSSEGFKMDYGGHDSIFENNLIMSYPYDGQQCYNVATPFKSGHGDKFRHNRCLIGLGRKRGSGCGDPSCASDDQDQQHNNNPPLNDNNIATQEEELIGTLQGGCDEKSHFELESNSYYTPTGIAKINCGGQTYSLDELQTKYPQLEIGSIVKRLPEDESIILQWAHEILNHHPAVDKYDWISISMEGTDRTIITMVDNIDRF